jgi:hypothetical protein
VWPAVAARFNPEPIDLPAALQARPNFPMAQRLRTERADGRVTVSCLASDLEFRWQLREAGEGTEVRILPDKEAHRLRTQRALLTESIDRLAARPPSGGWAADSTAGPPHAIEVPRGERLRLQPQVKLLPRRLGGQRGQWGGDERSAGPTSEDGASVNAYVRDVLDTTHTTPPRA